MSLNHLFEILKANSSRNFKIATLQSHKENELLKRVIFLALDPFTQFYIRKIPEYTIGSNNITLETLNELNKLSGRVYTGNAGIEFLRTLLSSLTPDDATVIERIISKDLKCGVSTATVNSVWDNLIKEYPCMLCSQVDNKTLNNIKFPAYAQLKMDGMRFNAIVKDNIVEFRTRNGRLLPLSNTKLEQDIINMSNGESLVFDGELLVSTYDRKTGNGILNKALKGTISSSDLELINASLWDVIDYDDFMNGKSNIIYKERFNKLHSLYRESSNISIVNTHIVNNIQEAYDIFNLYLARNEEGIILKDFNNKWENKRSKTLLKFKGEYECDLRIVDVIEGNGAFSGSVGAFLCKTDDGLLEVSVGTGFTEEQRKYYMDNKPINKIVTIKYNAKITSKAANKKDSLFLPVFVVVREDKNETDTIETIL